MCIQWCKRRGCRGFVENLGKIPKNIGKISANLGKIPKHPSKIPENLGKNGAQRCLT